MDEFERTDVVIANDGKNPTYELDLGPYSNQIVFSRPRRIRSQIWGQVFGKFETNRPLNYLEIGSQEGSSLLWFFDNILTHPASVATVVDPFVQPGTRETFSHNMRVSGYRNRINLHVGGSGEKLRNLPLYSYDIIYIDGLHSIYAVLEDIMLAWRLCKDGGIIILDDYEWKSTPNPLNWPKTAVDVFLYAYQGKYELLAKGWQVVVRKIYPDGIVDQYVPEST